MRRLLATLVVVSVVAAGVPSALAPPSLRFLQRDAGALHAVRFSGRLVAGGTVWAKVSGAVPGQRVAVDWGDGSPPARLRGARCGVQASPACAVGTRHVYSSAGAYWLTVRAGRRVLARRHVAVLPAGAVAPLPAPPPVDAWRGEMLVALNQLRRESGASPLIECAALDRSAQAYAQLIGPLDWFSHTGPGGSTARDRIIAAGYAPTAMGENLAGGTATVGQTMTLWRGSPGHLYNMVSSMFSHVGFGQYEGGGHMSIWVQDFGRGVCPGS